jgi:hypothetical protein
MGNCHDLVAHIITVFVLSLKRLFDQFEHVSAASLVAATAADAFFDINGFDEFWCPCLSASRKSYNRHMILL